MIELFHDDFFTFPNGNKANHMKISQLNGNTIILHPNFYFDPTPGGGYARDIEIEFLHEDPARMVEERFLGRNSHFEIMPNEVYHQKFRLKMALDPIFVKSFVDRCLDSFAAISLPDEVFWYETGYWTMRHEDNQFMGIGLSTLKDAFEETRNALFRCCLANRDSVAVIGGSPENDTTDVDFYVTNAFLPFAEIADIFRSSIEKLGQCRSLGEELILETTIHSRYSPESLFLIRPKSLVLMEDHPVLAAIKNPIRRTSTPIASLDCLVGSTAGGFIESDFTEKKDFRLRVDQWIFGDTTIFQFFFIREMRFDRFLEIVGLKEYAGIYA